MELREWENDINDASTLNDDVMVNVLCESILYKFFLCPNMRSQPLLLQHLVDMWDIDVGNFMVGDQILWLEIEDIYFLTRLSWRGEITLLARGWRELTEPVDQYIVQYRRDGARKSSNKFPVRDVMDLTLKNILFCISQVVGSISPDLATKSQVNYTMLCRDGDLYNWCATLLASMKEQLTKCKVG